MGLFSRAKKAVTGTKIFQKIQKAYTARSHDLTLQKIEKLKRQAFELERMHDALSKGKTYLLAGRVPVEWDFASFQRDRSSRVVSWPSRRTVENIPSEFIDHWDVSLEPEQLVEHVSNKLATGIPAKYGYQKRLETARQVGFFVVKEQKNLNDLNTLASEVERHLKAKRLENEVDASEIRKKILEGRIKANLTANITFEGVKRFLNARHPDSDLRMHPHIQVFEEMIAIAGCKPVVRPSALEKRLERLKAKIALIHDKIASLKQK